MELNSTTSEDKPKQRRSLGLPAMPRSRRGVISAIALGIVGGFLGALVFVRFVPAFIPTSKQAVLVQQSSAAIDVANRVSPSVVSITSESTGFSFFGRTQNLKGAGTGFIVTSDGLIVTNNHVIEGAQNLTVFTSDGKEYKNAQVVARDPGNDLAFVRVNASNLKAVELGDSGQVKVGTGVIAIGNALGQYQNTVTEGIISGIGRPVTAGDQSGGNVEQLQNMFQTDAAINSGNSGGPLVDLTGKVIGINTAVAGDAQNIGFAIPINQAKAEINSVKQQGKIVKPYLGVRYIPVTKEFASSNNLSVTYGAYISGDSGSPGVVPDSPAAKAGLKETDIITKIDNQKLDESHPLSSVINNHKIGDKLNVTYLRDGKESTVEITLAEAPQS
jgi:S1-C subfamily serine protease